MSETDYSRIRLGSTKVGILGMMQAFQQIAQSYSGESDEELGVILLTYLRKRNYISKSAEAEYTKALVREFRKFMGHPRRSGTAKCKTESHRRQRASGSFY
jgi:hypothetical protein